MKVTNIYGEVNQHEYWKCECKEGIFYVDGLRDYKVIHWNYPEINPTKELIEKARTVIEQKKERYRLDCLRYDCKECGCSYGTDEYDIEKGMCYYCAE